VRHLGEGGERNRPLLVPKFNLGVSINLHMSRYGERDERACV
jgi:hypothetical protein